MIFRWLGRALFVFLGRKVWEAYRRRRATSPGPPTRR